MHGNVFEWCFDYYNEDWYANEAEIALNPTGPATGLKRVYRGGSWWQRKSQTRSAFRGRHFPSFRFQEHGIRLALSVEAVKKSFARHCRGITSDKPAMTSSFQTPNPYSPTTELSEDSLEDLEKSASRLLKHADRVWLSLIGLAFLGLLGPFVYTCVFLYQRRECDRLIEACRKATPTSVGRLREAKARFGAAATLYAILLVAEIIYFGGVIFFL